MNGPHPPTYALWSWQAKRDGGICDVYAPMPSTHVRCVCSYGMVWIPEGTTPRMVSVIQKTAYSLSPKSGGESGVGEVCTCASSHCKVAEKYVVIRDA